MSNRLICLALGIFFVFLLGATGAFARDYTYSCMGIIKVGSIMRPMPIVNVEKFRASASSTFDNPDAIRVLAFRSAFKCITTAWTNRHNPLAPRECGPLGGVSAYDATKLLTAIEKEACNAWGVSGRVRVRVQGEMKGAKGCGGNENLTKYIFTLTPSYPINC